MSEVFVSIIMSAHNEEKYIRQAVDSILNQTHSNFELIVFDDGSTDQTAAIIESYSDSRLLFIKDGKNKNQAVRANEGIKLATGKYIARMDADDISLPQRLEKQVHFLENNPTIDIVGGQINLIQSGNICNYKKLPIKPAVLKAYSIFFCPFVHSTVIARANVFKENLYHPDFVVAQDFHLFTQILNNYKGANLSDVLVHYRIHDENVHQQNPERLLSFVKRVFLTRFKMEGVNITDKELSTQLLFSESNKTYLSKSQLLQIDDWLHKLLQLNSQKEFAKEEALKETFAYVWREILWKIKKEHLQIYLRKAVGLNFFSIIRRADYAHLFKLILK